MTTIGRETVACVACSALSDQCYLASTTTFGPPDLNLRPSELARSALWLNVQECPSCGYCAPRISEGDPYVSTMVRDEHYVALRASSEFPDLARRFLCSGWLLAVSSDDANAGWATLSAAWVCDDEGLEIPAGVCRAWAVANFALHRRTKASRPTTLPSTH